MNSQKGIISVVIAILLALFIGGGVFYAVQQEKIQKEEDEQAVSNLLEQAKNSPRLEEKEVAEAEMADWKVYRDEKYGFEFKYPREWQNCTTIEVFCVTSAKKREFTQITPTIVGYMRNELLSKYPNYASLLKFLKDDAEKTNSVGAGGLAWASEVKVGNDTAIDRCFGDDGWKCTRYLFKGNNLFAFEYTDVQETENREDMITEQILSTFKFTSFTEDLTSEEKAILAAREVIKILAARDYQKLEALVSPDGLSISFYPNFISASKNLIPKNEISKITQDTKLYLWGYSDGRGDPINLTRAQALMSGTVDYLKAPNVAVNKTLGGGNSVNTIDKDANGRTYVAFHFSGFDPKYGGMDWTTKYLIFDIVNGEYKLRGLALDNWTI